MSNQPKSERLKDDPPGETTSVVPSRTNNGNKSIKNNNTITEQAAAAAATTTTTSNPQQPKKTAFVHKLYAMLSDPNLSHLIWWSRKDEDGVFALNPGSEFANALTTYFKHGNVSSFVRQLHMYGFHKVFDTNSELAENEDKSDDLVWEFKHSTGHFKKGDEESLSMIKRRSSNRVVPEDEFKPQHEFYYPPSATGPSLAPPPPHSFPHQQAHYLIPAATDPHQVQHHHIVPMYQDMSAYPQHPLSVHVHPGQPIYDYHQQASVPPPPPPAPQTTAASPSQRQTPDHVESVTNELQHQQRVISMKSDYLHNELRSTAGDVIRFTDNIPKFAPALVETSPQYRDKLSSLQENFHNRAEMYRQQVPPPQTFPKPLVNPFTTAAQKRNQSIHFWETSGQRQPSVFVDPLNASSPSGSISGPSTSNSSTRSSAVSLTATGNPAYPFHHQLLHQQPLRNANSVPHIQYQQAQQLHHQKSARNDSLPAYFQPGSGSGSLVSNVTSSPGGSSAPSSEAVVSPPIPASGAQPRPPRQYPPRSIPDEARSGSIPNISHLTSQLRPSLVELHSGAHAHLQQHTPAVAPPGTHHHPLHHHHQSVPTGFAPTSMPPSMNNSLSSQSTQSTTLYSAQSSISSISSRNSMGSFSGVVMASHEQQAGGHAYNPSHLQRVSTSIDDSNDSNSSIKTLPKERIQELDDEMNNDKTNVEVDDDKSGKLTVKSLLSSPGKQMESGMKRSKEDEAYEGKVLKRAKSVLDLK